MGTNFYFTTMDKELAHKFNYEIDEEPDLHYSIHLAKTSMGWLPLFQEHKNMIQSVADIKKVFDTYKDKLRLVDEYDEEYTWEQFEKRVLNHNGGVYGREKRYKIDNKPGSPFYDESLPETGPISHLEYNAKSPHKYTGYFKDPEGYEFDTRWFA